jgi:hypothetical protein
MLHGMRSSSAPSVCRNASTAFLMVCRNASTAFLMVCRNALTAFLMVLLFVTHSATAGAQDRLAPAPRRLIISERAIAAALAAATTVQNQQPRRDSLKNGAIIGAVVGALALALPGGFICHALHEEGNPPCWRGTLMVGAIGAGIGAAAGAGIDAALSRTSQFPIRSSPATDASRRTPR